MCLFAYNRSVPTLLEWLSSLAITEEGHGVIALPVGDRIKFDAPPELLLRIPDVGLLHTWQLTPETARRVPRWQGTDVAGGELFVADHGSGAYFLLVNETSVNRVIPDRDPSLAPDLVEEVAALKILWEAA